MSQQTVVSNETPYTSSSVLNALSFMIMNALQQEICTADVVMVTAVEAGGAGNGPGYVTVKPLVCQVAAKDNTIIQPVELFKLPYSRIQGGVAAVVIDPEPGDIGIAIYMKRDSSGVGQGQAEPVKPGSFRTFDQADGFYIGGFLNKAPEVFLEMMQDGTARLVAPESVRIETKSCVIQCETFTVNASTSVALNSPSWGFYDYSGTGPTTGAINGDIRHIGNTEQTGNFIQTGNIDQTGGITSSGNHVAGGISLNSHTHSGVTTGSGQTGGPQ